MKTFSVYGINSEDFLSIEKGIKVQVNPNKLLVGTGLNVSIFRIKDAKITTSFNNSKIFDVGVQWLSEEFAYITQPKFQTDIRALVKWKIDAKKYVDVFHVNFEIPDDPHLVSLWYDQNYTQAEILIVLHQNQSIICKIFNFDKNNPVSKKYELTWDGENVSVQPINP